MPPACRAVQANKQSVVRRHRNRIQTWCGRRAMRRPHRHGRGCIKPERSRQQGQPIPRALAITAGHPKWECMLSLENIDIRPQLSGLGLEPLALPSLAPPQLRTIAAIGTAAIAVAAAPFFWCPPAWIAYFMTLPGPVAQSFHRVERSPK